MPKLQCIIMQLKASQICQLVNGELHGNPDTVVSSFSNIEEAQKGDITFFSDHRYKKQLQTTKASIIIIPDIDLKINTTTIKVENPINTFSRVLDLFKPKYIYNHKISKNSQIDLTSKISKNVHIGDFCVIEENVNIEENCIIEPNTYIKRNVQINKNSHIGSNVTIYHDCIIGENCIIHAGVVIGSDGFGFIPYKNELSKMPQVGKVMNYLKCLK